MRSATSVLGILFCALILAGCTAGQLPKSHQSLYLHDNKADYRTAWDVISEEMRNPTVSGVAGLCENHVAYLKVLSTIIDRDFAPDNGDLLAEESYEYVLDNCQQKQEWLELAENFYGLFFTRSYRSGKAIAHIKKAIDLSQPESFNQFINQANLSGCYADMGKFDLRDHYLSRSIETGRKYFKNMPRQISGEYIGQLNSYCSILTARLDDLSWATDAQHNLPEMHRLWKDLEATIQRWYTISSQYSLYIRPIQSFAVAGDIEFAQKLLHDIKALNKKYPYRNQKLAESDFLMTQARIFQAQGRTQQAAEMLEEWAEQREISTEKILTGNDLRMVGLALEESGNYPRAMYYLQRSLGEFEKLRSSFALRSRGQVLSGMTIKTYWGLLRSTARQFLHTRQPALFTDALMVARMLRARQFGELLGIDNQLAASVDDSNLKLNPEELLINFIVTDSAIVIFEIAVGHRDVKIIPIELEKFNRLLKRAKMSLAEPNPNDDPSLHLMKISALIIEPLIPLLSSYKRIIAIPDGTLAGIPFAILSDAANSYSPLLLEHEVVLTPSLSYFIQQRDRQYEKSTGRLLAVADPVFDSPSIPSDYQDETHSFYIRAINAFELFEPLPETRQEVRNITAMFPPEQTMTLFGAEATKAKFLEQNLPGYRYLHFATHGILGNQIPGINQPAIVLTAGAGSEFAEHFLTLEEVQELKLDAELTVLSACDTGSGEFFMGEGVMGMSRGFLLAGSRSVVVSLWPVASKTTVTLMTNFYRHLRSGESKAESIRMAQMELLNDPEYSSIQFRGVTVKGGEASGARYLHPFYWAPFVLIGD